MLHQLFALFEEEGRADPPITPAGAVHGAVGYVCLAALVADELRGLPRPVTAGAVRIRSR